MYETPNSVLFACTMNVVRSPMAAVLLRNLTDTQVASAGVRVGEPDPLAGAAMAEIGLDLPYEPRRFEELKLGRFDLIITLSPEAQHRAKELTRNIKTAVEYWPTQDPSAVDGSREQRLAAYRVVRDDLARRLKARFLTPGVPST